MKPLIILLLMVVVSSLVAQDKSLPYSELPSYPESFTGGAVASRVIDGLGFRFYWATDGLRPEDLSYKPTKEARTSQETIEHIYGLTTMILMATQQTADISGSNSKMSFAELRRAVLQNLKTASDKLRGSSDQQLKDFKIKFNGHEYPFWNQLNGPIADCL
jgi:hypothetical protein